MPRSRPGGAAVAGLTFVVVGVLLLLEGVGTFDVPAGVIPAVLLIGLGLSVLARRA